MKAQEALISLKRGDTVEITRGAWKGYGVTVRKVFVSFSPDEIRVDVEVILPDEWKEAHPFAANPLPFSLAPSSIKAIR